MIGIPSLLLELALPTFFAVMLVAVLVEAVRKRSGGAAMGSAIVLAVAVLVGSRFYYQVQSRRVLQSLRADDVRQVRLGEQRIRRPEQIAAVVEALNRIDWFSSNHGGWGERQWLLVDLKSSGRLAFLVAKYHRQEGAIIHFGRPAGGGGFHDGYAFSASLPAVLEQAGAPLEP
jgi:hypothetical protein